MEALVATSDWYGPTSHPLSGFAYVRTLDKKEKEKKKQKKKRSLALSSPRNFFFFLHLDTWGRGRASGGRDSRFPFHYITKCIGSILIRITLHAEHQRYLYFSINRKSIMTSLFRRSNISVLLKSSLNLKICTSTTSFEIIVAKDTSSQLVNIP